MSSFTTDEGNGCTFLPLMVFGALTGFIIFIVVLHIHADPTLHPEFSVSAFNISSSSSATNLSFALTARYRDPNNTILYDPISARVIYAYNIPVGNMALSSSRRNEFEGRFDFVDMPVSGDLAEGIRSDIRLYGEFKKFEVIAYSKYAWWYPFSRLTLICDMVWVEFNKVKPDSEEVFGSLDHPIECYQSMACAMSVSGHCMYN